MNSFSWKPVESLPSGLVDISRYYGRLGQSPDLIWARTEIVSDGEQTKQLAFGYSDYISIFLNGKLLFIGNSQYQSRDANFQGIIGYNDYIFLPLRKGKNELVIAVAEAFGGWGFMFRDVDAIYQVPGMTKKWEIKNTLKYPESIVYDNKRDVLYVSNLTYENGGFISKIKMNGEIEKIDFITGILQPAGLCINNDKLYIVGRFALVEYDLEKNVITRRFQFPGALFANDVACDESGTIYVTDGAKSVIFRLENGVFTEWMKGETLSGVNGITTGNGKVYIGTTGDGSLKSIDAATREVTTIFTFGTNTVIDGLAKDGKGNFLISDHAGRLFRITPEGKEELLMNTESRSITLADFEFVEEKEIIAIPTLGDNRVMVFEMK